MLVIPCRDFFKVLSSRSFFKGKQLWVSKSNMADKTSYCTFLPPQQDLSKRESPSEHL